MTICFFKMASIIDWAPIRYQYFVSHAVQIRTWSPFVPCLHPRWKGSTLLLVITTHYGLFINKSFVTFSPCSCHTFFKNNKANYNWHFPVHSEESCLGCSCKQVQIIVVFNIRQKTSYRIQIDLQVRLTVFI